LCPLGDGGTTEQRCGALTEGEVLGEFRADRSMSAELPVEGAFDEQRLPSGSVEAREEAAPAVGHVPEVEHCQQRNDKLLGERSQLLVWHDRQEAPSVLLAGSHDRGKAQGCVDGIGIGEEQPFPLSLLGKLVACPGFADPALGKRCAADDPEPFGEFRLQLLQYSGGAIGGFIIEHEHLIVWILLAAQGAHTGGNSLLLIACGDEHGHLRRTGCLPCPRLEPGKAAQVQCAREVEEAQNSNCGQQHKLHRAGHGVGMQSCGLSQADAAEPSLGGLRRGAL
jgi:hypothetical protein